MKLFVWGTGDLWRFGKRFQIDSELFWARTTDTQWRHKSKKSENLGRCGRQNMLWPYLKIWEWEFIFCHAVKAISLPGVHSPWLFPISFVICTELSSMVWHHFQKRTYESWQFLFWNNSPVNRVCIFPWNCLSGLARLYLGLFCLKMVRPKAREA